MITAKGIIKKVITPRKLGAMNNPELNFSFQKRLEFRFGGFTFFTGSCPFGFALLKRNFCFKMTPRILVVLF